MPQNYGKKFEDKFKQDWKKSFPDDFIYRIIDAMSGFKASNNACDFICFTQGHLFMIECKSHSGKSISFDAIPQYERLLPYKNIKNVHPGILVWFYDEDKVLWVDINEAEKLFKAGEKSIGIRHLNNYNISVLPSVKKRVFLDTDYKALLQLYEEK